MSQRWSFEHQYLGLERDWIAVNPDGQVGFFSTAGFGPIPENVLEEAFLERAFEAITDLPVVSDFELVCPSEGDITDWTSVAKRGIFAFDWNNSGKVFNLIVKPTSPILVESLEYPDLARVASSVVLEWDQYTSGLAVREQD